jgi:hypothetical protein
MAHKNHSRSGRFATIGSTSVKSFRGAGGSTGRSRETLDGFFFDSHWGDSPFAVPMAVI